MELNDIFTDEQVNSIRNIIRRQCQRRRQMTAEYPDLCAGPYSTYRGEHSLTSDILNGFHNVTIEGINITPQNYGMNNNMAHPVLSNRNVIANIFNSGCGFKSEPFRDNCRRYNLNTDELPIYVCIVFKASKDGVLRNIKIKIPNADGSFIKEFEIYRLTLNNAEIA